MKIKRDLVQIFLLGVMLLPVSVRAQFQWAERIASITNLPDDGPNGGIALDSQDNCYVTGFFDGTNNFGGVTLTNNNGGGQDIFVAKYNSTGVLQWAQRAGGNSSYSDEGRGIGVDNNGNIYVAGGFYGPANFGSINLPATDAGEFFLAKYNNAGAVQWVRQSVGGSFAEGTGLAVDGAGNSYVLGYAANGATYTFGSTNLAMPNNISEGAFLIKYDNTGAVQWAQVLGGSDEVYATKVAVDAAGNVYVRGTFYSTLTIGSSNLVVSAGSTKNMFVAKFSNAGALTWVQQPIGGDVDEGGVVVDPVGSVFVTGYFDANLDFGSGITLTNTANDNAPFGDAFVAKYNSSGAIQWAQPAGGTNGGFYWDVALDAQTNVYPAGFLGSDAAIAKYNSAGILQWTESANGLPASPVASTVSKCAVDAAGNCYLAGWYQGTNTFGTNTLQPQEVWNFFLAELGPSATVTNPTIQFTASPTNGAPPLTVQFNSPNVDSLGNAITNWNWNFGDGATSAAQNPSHTYASVGNFFPSLVAANNVGGSVAAMGPSIMVNPPFASLYNFTPTSNQTNSDGANPFAGLILSGNTLYGTASYGGNSGDGTVFAVNTDGTGFTNLYDFTGGNGGAYPYAGLILSGNTLYGTTLEGGSSGDGIVFAVNTDGTGFTNLYSFTGGNSGANPVAGLILSGNTLYGTTSGGGSSGDGAVFAINTDGMGFTNLYNFVGGKDGANPQSGLIVSGNTLYGTTLEGGSSGDGAVFAINTDGMGFTNLYNFAGGNSGANPYAGLILSGNTLYGTAYRGGSSGDGIVFAVNTDGTGFTNLYNFTGGNSGANPVAGLVLSGNTLYGTAYHGGSLGDGTVFTVNTDGTGFTNLYNFAGGNDGANPYAGLILSGNTLYGTASGGGSSGNGTVFSLMVVVSLQVATASLPNGTNGFAYSQQLSAINGQLPYTWKIISGALPSGLTLGANGLISGTPTTVVTTNFTVQVKDATNGIATQSLSLTIQAPAPLQILTTSLPNGTNGVAYNQALMAAGGLPPYSWTTISGALPPGLTLAANGLISGTPVTGGTFNFTAQVADALSGAATQPLVLTVGDPPRVALQPTNNSVAVTIGSSVNFAVSVAGTGPFSYHWQLNGTNLLGSIINTVAGGYIGDGGVATHASLESPWGVTVDALGNVFIADGGHGLVRKIDTNGIITTVAGGGNYGYVGDGGPATNASLNSPWGVAIDASGNLFIADSGDNLIRRVDANGIITTVAGNGNDGYSGDGGSATNATLANPRQVVVDASGNLFIADSANDRIRKVDTNGIISTVAGNGIYGYSGDGGLATNAALSYPSGVAVDASGNLLIADSGNSRIRKVNANGIITTVAGGGFNYPGDGGPATNASLSFPSGLAVDTSGNLFIADTYDGSVHKVNTSGVITTVAGNGSDNYYSGDGGPATNAGLSYLWGVAVDVKGNVFIADSGNNRIREVGTNGVISTIAGGFIGDGEPATNASLFSPSGVAVDGFGNLFIADTDDNLIRKLDTSGIITTVAGNGNFDYSGDGGPATNASLANPDGVVVDSSGNLFIADTYNSLIRKMDINGIITTFAGGGNDFPGDGELATNAALAYPSAVVTDASGNLFIADTVDNLVRKVDTNGILTTVAGGGSDFPGDGELATNVSLYYPSGVAVDTSGNLFIADSGNNLIRRVDTNGILTTVAGGGSDFPGDGELATNVSLSLSYMSDIALDQFGDLFVVDSNDNLVRKVDASGIITTVTGNGNDGYSGDGGLATNASLANPEGLAVDEFGNLFVADSGNNRIREVTGGPALTLTAVGLNNAGNYDVVVSGPYGSVTSSVVNVAIAIQITPSGLAYGTNDTAYNQQLSATYGQPPYRWSLADGSLPPGLTLANNGLISGTPTTNGTFNFTVQVTDAASSTATQPFTLTVFGPPSVAIIQPTNDLVTIAAGNNVNLAVSVAGFGPFSYQWQLNGTNLPNGMISTVAGGGSDYPGDGGPATNAELDGPIGLAVDAIGNLFIAEQSGQSVRKVGPDGIIATVAGNGNYGYSGNGGPATNAEFYYPDGVAADTAGNLFIADSYNNVIREVGTNGIITTVAGDGPSYPGTGGYAGDGGAATNAKLNNPYGVVVDATGNLFIADSVNSVIREVGTNGIITSVAGNGNFGYSGDGGPAIDAELSYPACVAVDATGNLFIADQNNNVIREVGTNGIITTVAGNGTQGYSGDGGAATNAELFLNDQYAAGSGVAVDATGNLFIADAGNNIIREVRTNGIITTVAGNGTQGYSGDGGAATNAEFYYAFCVAVDTAGNLFIADNGNGRIRKVVIQGPTLALNDVNFRNGGAYDVVVSSPYGSVTSGVVNVTITLSSIVLSAPQINVRNNNFAFTLSGPVGSNYVLQVSTNLVNWSPVSTSTIPVSGTITLTNAISGYNNRFYRTYLQ